MSKNNDIQDNMSIEDSDFDNFLMFKCNSLKNQFIKCLDEYEKKLFFKKKKMKACENKEKEFINCYLLNNIQNNQEIMSLKSIKNEDYKLKSEDVKKKYLEKSTIENPFDLQLNGEKTKIIEDSMNKNVRLKEFKF